MSEIKLTIDGTEYEPTGKCCVEDNDVVIRYGRHQVIYKPKVIPKHDYYELFSYGEGINSVKRHSDGEIYSIGGFAEVKSNDGSVVNFIIRKFELEPNGDLMVCLVNHSARYNLSLLEPKAKLKEKDIPKDWEILSFFNERGEIYEFVGGGMYSNGIGMKQRVFDLEFLLLNHKPIHSVKRLDGEVFTVGDICEQGEIKRFSYSDLSKNITAIFESGALGCERYLRDLEKVKPRVPLFNIKSIDIFEGDTFWTINKNTFNLLKWKAYSDYPHQWQNKELEYFPTEEYANDYIYLHLPIQTSHMEFLDGCAIGNWSKFHYDAIKEYFKSKIKIL